MKKIINYFNRKIFIKPMKIKKRYDYVIVFGGFDMDLRIREVVNLYKNKVVNKIIVSGNHSLLGKSKIKECDYMYNLLLKNEVLDSDILREEKSVTTLQNIKNSIKLIDKNTNVLLISNEFHLKRIITLMNKFKVSFNYDYLLVRDGITDRENWYLNKVGKKMIFLEWVKGYISFI